MRERQTERHQTHGDNHMKKEGDDSHLPANEGGLRHTELRFSASETVRRQIAVVEATQSVVLVMVPLANQ